MHWILDKMHTKFQEVQTVSFSWLEVIHTRKIQNFQYPSTASLFLDPANPKTR